MFVFLPLLPVGAHRLQVYAHRVRALFAAPRAVPVPCVPLWLVHRGGGKGTACVPLSCSSSQSAALRGEGQCAGLLRELQLQVSDCEWCSHHRQPCPTVCSRCCGPLRHSDGRQEQQQDCFASSFMDPVTMLARVGMNLGIGFFIL